MVDPTIILLSLKLEFLLIVKLLVLFELLNLLIELSSLNLLLKLLSYELFIFFIIILLILTLLSKGMILEIWLEIKSLFLSKLVNFLVILLFFILNKV